MDGERQLRVSCNKRHVRSRLSVVFLVLFPLLLLGLNSQVSDKWISTGYQQGVGFHDGIPEASSVTAADSRWHYDINMPSGSALVPSKRNYTPAADSKIPFDEQLTRPVWYEESMFIPAGYGMYGEFEIVGIGYVMLDVVDEDQHDGLDGYWHSLGSFSESRDLSFSWIVQWSRNYYFQFHIPNWVASYGTPPSTAHIIGFIGIDETPPEISLELKNDRTSISLDAGSTVTVSGEVTIEATITDEVFGIDSANLYMDSNYISRSGFSDGTNTQCEWDIDTTEYANGDHIIMVLAADRVGNEKAMTIYLHIQNENLTPLVLGAATVIGVVAIIGAAMVMKRRGGEGTPAEPTFMPPQPPEDDILESHSDTRTITAPAQIVCDGMKSEPIETQKMPEHEIQQVIIDESLSDVRPVESDVIVQALRGGEFVGNRFRFKVKVVNRSPFVITDITVGLISYPKDTLRIEGSPVKTIAKLEPNGYRSPTFDFLPTEDCVKGDIIASVSYVDSRGNAHSITTKSFTIRAVCDLLRPESISPAGFMLKLAILGHGEMMSRVEDWTPEEMHEKTLNILRDSNFFVVTRDLSQVGDDHVESKIKGWAKGIYTGNNLGVQVTITGRPGIKGATCKVKMSGEDEAMIMPAIDEISQKLSAWLCPKCSGALPVELVNELKAGKSVSCPFCSVTMDR